MDIKEIKKRREKYECGNLNNSKGMETSVEMMYHVTVKIQKLLKTLYLIIGCLAVTNAITLIALITRSVKNPYVPYVIRVDKDSAVNGQVLTGQQIVSADDKMVEYFLVDFVKKIRTVYKDKSFVKIDDKKYQVNFTEKTYSQNGYPEREARYTMVAFLEQVPVNSTAMIRMNPLGLVIKDVEFGNISTSQNQIQNPATTTPPTNVSPTVEPVPAPAQPVPPTQ